ncbi:hypothetical protein [Pedococcus bigeumensis]|uniref:Uncharacterized protein n=1 Tax=Pedococcus bigeumensis TaxID=433644 RepID=A0A502CPX1_9MICO|nr:hypothetical protein [Pedococcus bigeumensis]TPG14853.1 hypothetical protein EAH86_14940 [Pedococcus bigeumensis]
MTAPVVAVQQLRPHSARWPRIRLVALCAIYALLSLWALVMTTFGTVMVLLGRLPDPSWTFGALAAGAFKLLTLGPALVILASRGRSALAVRALILGQLVWLAADLVAPEEPASAGERLGRSAVSLVLWVGPWLLLSDHRSRLWRDPVLVRRPLLALALMVAAACWPWAVAITHLDPTTKSSLGTTGELRYDIVGFPIAVVAGLCLGALCGARWWDRTVCVALVWVAVSAAIAPTGFGSPGYAGCLLAVIAGLLNWATRHAPGHP